MKNTFKAYWRAFCFFWKLSPGYWIYSILSSLVSNASFFFTIFINGVYINRIIDSSPIEEIIRLVIIELSVFLFLNTIRIILNKKITLSEQFLNKKENIIRTEKTTRIPYAELEKTELRQLQRKISEDSNMGYGRAMFMSNVKGLLNNFILFIISSILFCQLVFNIRKNSTVGSEWLIIIMYFGIFFFALSGYFLNKYLNKKESVYISQVHRSYIEANRLESTVDCYEKGKDIRLYKQSAFMLQIHDKINNFFKSYRHELSGMKLKHSVSKQVLIMFRKIFVFFILCLYAIRGIIPVGNVITYVSYTEKFIISILESLSVFAFMKINTPFIEQYMSYYDYPEEDDRNLPSVHTDSTRNPVFRLQDVHYSYANCSDGREAVSGVSLTLERNKKYAIVGPNGSGKTTLVKLLCKLYRPSSGSILYEGCDIANVNGDNYREHLSVLFQDYHLLSATLEQNISFSTDTDREKILHLFEQIGFSERFASLPDGFDTNLYRDFEEDGVELSGGEAQKVAMVRTLYKDADIIILDEPTAALDAISESEFYFHFNEATDSKTAVFISHRLASCKFCDEIIVMDHGKVVQIGTHDELLSEKDGLYRQLWLAQVEQFQ